MFGLKKLLRGNSLGIPRDVMAKLTTPPRHTPDAAELESRNYNLVFLYGNEMSGGRTNNVDVKPLYKDVFTHDPFVMIGVKKGEMIAPVVLTPPHAMMRTKTLKAYVCDDMKQAVTTARIAKLRPAPIKGELYQLTDREVEHLDNEYANGVMFDRVRIRVRVEHYAVSKHKVGRTDEMRMSEPLYHDKRVHCYVGRYAPFASFTILNTELLKERTCNSNYAPRYFYTRQDWE